MKSSRCKAPRSLRADRRHDNVCTMSVTTRALSHGALAMAMGFSAGTVLAQSSDDETITLDTISIRDRTLDTNPYAEEAAPYKARISGDVRHTRPLAQTPQTINVLTQTQVQESGKTDLKEILAAQPGITLGTGENGNAFGDRYIIRGHEARSDVFVDGLRDPGMTTREAFATEQIEVTKGPSSTFAGRGSTGGAVNGITKQASTDYDLVQLSAGLGTDEYHRLTIDANKVITDDLALRANLLHAYEEVPERGPADRERTGALLSASWYASEQLTLSGDFYWLDASDLPDLGSFFVQETRSPYDDIPVYAQADADFLNTEVLAGTFKAAYRLDNGLTLRNAVRFGTTDNGYVVTGARGAVRDATDPDAPYAFTITLSGHQGWQEVEYFAEQAIAQFAAGFGATEHEFIFGVEYIDESVTNGVYAIADAASPTCIVVGRNGPAPGVCALDATGVTVANLNGVLERSVTRGSFDSSYDIKTVSAYLMDTVDLGDRFTAFFGVRFDHFDYANAVRDRSGLVQQYDYADSLWNGHAGVVYQLTDEGNLYATFSTSSNINGGESDVGGSCGYGGLCGSPQQVSDSKPESVQNIEVGTKWNVLDERLLLTAALFQITKDDVMESVGDAYSTIGTLNTGRNRVRGIELAATGNISDAMSVQAGASFMTSKVLASFNAADVGRALSNFANNSAYLQLRYKVTPEFVVGGTVTYKGRMFGGQPDTAAGFNTTLNQYSIVVPSYTALDLFASYQFNEQLSARVNVGNVTDEVYYLAAYRSGTFMYLGDPRNARLTVNYSF
ncbi:MAG: TonB-dependent receptor [Gammaproteobacteria bacterium]|nr:TonB-dependent receptor [Gammaproteobacteria bacterium]